MSVAYGRIGGPESRGEKRPLASAAAVRSTIIKAMRRIAEEQKISLPTLRDDMSLHETGFDSLGFAILVARLENDLGIDPLSADEGALPSTVGDFVRAYEKVAA